jgi:hypothetical protein
MKTKSNKILSLASLLALTVSGNAATITYAGFQANVDAKQTSSPVSADSVGWRNADPVKTYDIDGDNILGTDGYQGRAGNSDASYITSFATTGGGNSFGYVDNPLDPTGIDTARAGFKGSTSTDLDLFSFAITGTDLDGQILGVSIMYDAYGSGQQTYILEQRDGGTGGSVITSDLALLNQGNDGYDWATFEVSGATAGDVFVLRATRTGLAGSAGRVTYSQVAFDTVPEPSSTALLGLGGLALILRRRK